MKLATVKNDARDGELVVVCRQAQRYVSASEIASTLQEAIDNWGAVETALRSLSDKLDKNPETGVSVKGADFAAPLPRAWQWLDGSVYPSHGALMERALGVEPIKTNMPLMYQGISDHFYGPTDDVAMASEEFGIDFEGEFGIVTDCVPMGVAPADALNHIKLLVQVNDWSLRKLAGPEMKTGFGWIQAKPACSMAPFAVTPDELGESWKDGRIHLHLTVDWNDERFGNAHGGPMEFGFHDLIAHAARTRNLAAGTIIGSGTVSNDNFREVGSSCIAERRGIEIVDEGEPKTDFMKYGDRVRMEARNADGAVLFGAIDQRVVEA